MLQVTKEQSGTALVLHFRGTIEESVDFEKLIGPLTPKPSEIVVHCGEVSRINSDGVKAWVSYFTELQTSKIPVTLKECSPAIVGQINFISNFTGGAKVESINVPYSCTKCNEELVALFSTEKLVQAGLVVPGIKCTKCGGQAVFDDIPEEYFLFLSRT